MWSSIRGRRGGHEGKKKGTQFFGGDMRLPPLSIPLLVGNPVIVTFDSLLK